MSLRFSIIVPIYNVARYLPRFLTSLQAQGDLLSRSEIILVDDGSTDTSGALLEDWAEGRTDVILVRQKNQGLSAARNTGLDHATGEWIFFPDPDDELPPRFLAAIDEFLTDQTDDTFDLVVMPRIVRDERTGKVKDTHPLRGLFAQGERIITLDHSATEFQLAVNSGAVRRAALEETGQRFDSRVRPTFEDGHFLGRLLIERGTGIAVCPRTQYLWTRRVEGDSITQSSWRRPERYDDVFTYGYLDLLMFAESRLGAIPHWVARMVLYDLHWYLRVDRKEDSPLRGLDPATLDRLEAHMTSTLGMMDPRFIHEFDISRDPVIIAGLRSFRETAFIVSPASLRVHKRRPHALEYLHAGPRPMEVVLLDGAPIPTDGHDEEVEFFGRTRLIRRRLLFAGANHDSEIQLLLDGASVLLTPLVTGADDRSLTRKVRDRFSSRVSKSFGRSRAHGPQ